MPNTTDRLSALQARLQERQEQHLYRRLEALATPQGPEIRIGGERLLSFCSNDYLGLANHPAVIAALRTGAERYGVGSGAAHLVSGHSEAHAALEESLARFVGAPRALLFSTGYMANLGIAVALAGRRDTLLEDRLNHASLLDAARLSGATVRRYRHADADHVAQMAARIHPALILTDAVFSMDGDLAPLPSLHAIAEGHDAWLLVDDAHGLGVIGDGGGSLRHFGMSPAGRTILMGTLGKAFGTFGAFVAAEAAVIETLIQSARTYVYTTALPPPIAAATAASLRLVQEEAWRRERLSEWIGWLRASAEEMGFVLTTSQTPIQPLVLGSAARALAASRELRRHGLFVPAIRPPTVPVGAARLRITLSAAHSREQVGRLIDGLAQLAKALPA